MTSQQEEITLSLSPDFEDVENFLKRHDEIESIHDLHILAMTTTENVLLVHIVFKTEKSDQFLEEIKDELL